MGIKFKDLTGYKFGKLTVVGLSENRKYNQLTWHCKCDCGGSIDVVGYGLKRGDTKSCGCLIHEKRINKNKDISGNRYGRLLVIRHTHERIRNNVVWECECDCGNKVYVPRNQLINGNSLSCGCLHNEIIKNTRKTHGLSKTRIYKIWESMKKRCTNINSNSYENYGGRGIYVCKDWLESFEKFYEDMGDPPTNKHELDRINNDDGYYKENCRWATRSENGCNKRKLKNTINKYKGVKQISSGKYHASITKDNKYYYLGLFDNEIDAVLAYNKKAIELHGEFAYLNDLTDDVEVVNA